MDAWTLIAVLLLSMATAGAQLDATNNKGVEPTGQKEAPSVVKSVHGSTDNLARVWGHAQGTIHSPNYPSPSPPWSNNQWNIQVAPGKTILFSFEFLDIDSCCDTVYLYDGPNEQSPLIARFSGNYSNPPDMCTSDNTMFIHFTSDGSVQANGFNATYLEVDRDDPRCSLPDLAVRLRNGSTPNEGRVEVVYLNTTWGTICDDFWSDADAQVICRMLGKPSDGAKATSNAVYGQGSGPILLDDVSCQGNETSIDNCIHQGWGNNDCQHSEDAGVVCADLAVRLRNGSTPNEGRVEVVYLNTTWGTICDDFWSDADAQVICRMLGKPSDGAKATSNALYGQGSGPILLDDVSCQGNETSIDNCIHQGWGNNDCQHSEDAGVVCAEESSTTPEITTYAIKYTSESPIEPTTQGLPISSDGVHYTSDSYVDAITVDCSSDAWHIRIYLSELYKRHSDFDPSDIYLGRPGCQGYRSGDFLVIYQQYSNCLTHHTTTANSSVYTNTLVYALRDANYKFIIREYRFRIDVECDMASQETVSQHFVETHNGGRVRSRHPHISGSGHYNIGMTFYRDANFLYQLHGNPLTIDIGENIYVRVTTALSDWEVKMRVDSCYTLPSPGAVDFTFYLIRNRCATDVNTHVTYTSTHETRFVFRDFEYSTDQNNLYLYCTAVFCNTTDYSSVCDQSCHPSQVRSLQSMPETVLAWAETSSVIRQSRGRQRREAGEEYQANMSDQEQSMDPHGHLFLAAILISAVGISVIGVAVAIRQYRKNKRRPTDTI